MAASSTLATTPASPSYDGLVMVCSPLEAQRRVQELQAFVQSVMIKGTDYGVIPDTNGKPCLYQPGAQKLAELYGFAHRFTVLDAVKDWERGFFYFEVKTELTARSDGRFLGEGVGSCNSRESKYAQRWVTEKKLPAGVDKASLRRKPLESKFNPGTTYDVFLVGNEDAYSLVNTIQKMTCKRSFIHAVISVTRSSGLFTQDVEDLPAAAYGEVDDARPWERGDAAPAAAVVHRDMKPENVSMGTSRALQGSDLTPQQANAIEYLTPKFVGARTHQEVNSLVREAIRIAGGRAGLAYGKWCNEMAAQARAAIGPDPRPGIASATPTSAPAAGKAATR